MELMDEVDLLKVTILLTSDQSLVGRQANWNASLDYSPTSRDKVFETLFIKRKVKGGFPGIPIYRSTSRTLPARTKKKKQK